MVQKKIIILLFIFKCLLFCDIYDEFNELSKYHILIGGDLHFNNHIKEYIPNYNIIYPLKRLQTYFKDKDLIYFNTTNFFLNRKLPVPEKIQDNFLTIPDIKLFTDCNIDVLGVSAAIEHPDIPEKYIFNTVLNLNKYEIFTTGVRKSFNSTTNIIRKDLNGLYVTILSYIAPEFDTEPLSKYKWYKAGYLHNIYKDIESIKDKSDYIIVSLSRIDYDAENPKDYYVIYNHEILDIGADMIFYVNTDKFGPVEKYKNKYIFYGLGDILHYDYDNINDGIILDLEFLKNDLQKIHIYCVKNDNSEVAFQPVIRTGVEMIKKLNKILKISKRFKTYFKVFFTGGVIDVN